MTHQDVELLAIGAGPSNLALAVALEELAPALAGNCLLVDRADAVSWQPGLLLPWATSQISFLKDLVTLRNPCSEFSFVNFLHNIGRLDDFINLGNLWPYRSEISEYLAWVAASLGRVRVELGRECVRIEPRRDPAGVLVGWTSRFADGSTVGCRHLVIATGREPYLPPALAALPANRVVHSTRYVHKLPEAVAGRPRRVVVLGGGQSAAEMYRDLQEQLPDAEITWVMRSLGPSALQASRFSNEMYYPAVVDTVFGAPAVTREAIRAEMHRTNYSGVEPELLDDLYAERYRNRLDGRDRTSLVTMTELVGACESADGPVLELRDRAGGQLSRLPCDVVFVGTGFSRGMPPLVRQLMAELGLSEPTVSRRYRVLLDEPTRATCHLHGLNEDTHGVGDSLFSVMADRTAATVQDLLADRGPDDAGPAGPPDSGAVPSTVPWAVRSVVPVAVQQPAQPARAEQVTR
jgi:L-ornithine N5-oxygenase